MVLDTNVSFLMSLIYRREWIGTKLWPIIWVSDMLLNIQPLPRVDLHLYKDVPPSRQVGKLLSFSALVPVVDFIPSHMPCIETRSRFPPLTPMHRDETQFSFHYLSSKVAMYSVENLTVSTHN